MARLLEVFLICVCVIPVLFPRMPKARKSKRARADEPVFSVEQILDKKTTDGKVYYYLKWFGYDDSENTWEPEENLDCPQLIEDFERSFNSKASVKKQPPEKKVSSPLSNSNGKAPSAKKKPATSKGSGGSSSFSLQAKVKMDEKEDEEGEKPVPKSATAVKSGFARGLIAETILGATEEAGQIMFLIKW